MKFKITLLSIGMMFLLVHFSNAQNQANVWQKLNNPGREFSNKADRWARNYQALSLSLTDMTAYLSKAPKEENVDLKNSSFIFTMPMPDGSFSTFKMVESPVMEKGLADAFPGIKTYSAVGIDDPTATMRCDITQFGFHAMMLSANGSVFIDPVDMWAPTDYVCYYKRDALPQDFAQECLIGAEEEETAREILQTDARSISGMLRTYRLALACTGEYAAYYGGTRPGALAGMVTSVNRVNGVYERDMAIHMNLIANDTLLIYLVAATDPYTNNNGGTMLTQNQNNLSAVIGTANYDIGHVFSTGGGGIAGLGVICTSNQKAKGVTGLNTPIGDAFDIDYVAHEMGHQFGANHTFNSTAGSCGGGNRHASAAYEPGSASTIMGYAGICAPQDLQNHSDDYFHTKSFDEIINYTQLSSGNSCPVKTTVANSAPFLVVPGPYNIPLNTPFRLTAVANDPDGDAITYCWEEFDLGPAGNWNAPSGNAPIFRSFDPVITGTRLFPKLANILNNNTTIGEIKPSYARTLNFRCTVRDYVTGGAGVTYNDTTVKVIVASTGPFAILTPNTTGIVWVSNTQETVTWSVNSSDLPPVNTPFVNVLLSLDGGYTWPIVLGNNVPNNGSYSFTVPVATTTTARVMVEGAGNIFFDINDKNFSITPSVGMEQNEFSASVSLMPNPTSGMLTMVMNNAEKGRIDIVVTDITGKVVLSQSTDKNARVSQVSLDMESASPGLYFVQLRSAKATAMKKFIRN